MVILLFWGAIASAFGFVAVELYEGHTAATGGEVTFTVPLLVFGAIALAIMAADRSDDYQAAAAFRIIGTGVASILVIAMSIWSLSGYSAIGTAIGQMY